MASTTLSISSSSTIGDSRAPPRQTATATAASPQCVTLPTLPPPLVQSQSRAAKATAYCRKMFRNVAARATGEASVELATTTTETPEIIKTVQDAWEKVEDKYAVGSLAFTGAVAIYASFGMIGAIERLPLVPGVLELVGIGYTGWFAYKNLIFKPDREALLQKIKDTYKDIIGSN